MKKLALAALLAALVPAAASAQVTIKLGTLAPQGSTWHDILKELGQRWEQVSNGQVKLRIYAGGAQGSEGDMVRKMGIGQLQAASITNVGMHDVIPEPQVMSVPFLFDDEPQMECAFEKLRGRLDAALEQRGLIALQWSRIGSVQLFCTKPYRTPADAKEAKVWAWEGDPKSVDAYRAAGLHPVVLSATDIMPSLQTGMIDCVPNVPLYVLTARLFDKAKFMLDVPWSYIIGATLVRKETWEKIPADLRPKLIAAAAELGAQGGRGGEAPQRRRGHGDAEAGARGREGGRGAVARRDGEVLADRARRRHPRRVLRRGEERARSVPRREDEK